MDAAFRASLGTDVDDPRLAQLVGELSLASKLFGGCGRGTTSTLQRAG